jgi:hypothetical protein
LVKPSALFQFNSPYFQNLFKDDRFSFKGRLKIGLVSLIRFGNFSILHFRHLNGIKGENDFFGGIDEEISLNRKIERFYIHLVSQVKIDIHPLIEQV